MFLYGSSMSDYRRAPRASGMLEFVGLGYVRGMLYEVAGTHPSARRAGLDRTGAGLVDGELWVLQKDLRLVLPWLDRLEGYCPDDLPPGYCRSTVTVLPDEVAAWAYCGEHPKELRLSLPGVRSWREVCPPSG